MPKTISSSQPANLWRFADLLSAHSDTAVAEGRRLDDALDRLAAGCREYPLGGAASQGGRLQALSRRNSEHAGWVRGVAAAFVAADSAVLSSAVGAPIAPAGLLAAGAGSLIRWREQIGQGALRFVGAGRSPDMEPALIVPRPDQTQEDPTPTPMAPGLTTAPALTPPAAPGLPPPPALTPSAAPDLSDDPPPTWTPPMVSGLDDDPPPTPTTIRTPTSQP